MLDVRKRLCHPQNFDTGWRGYQILHGGLCHPQICWTGLLRLSLSEWTLSGDIRCTDLRTEIIIIIKLRLHQIHLQVSRTSNEYPDAGGYKCIRLVSGLHASGVNAALQRAINRTASLTVPSK